LREGEFSVSDVVFVNEELLNTSVV